MVFWSISYCWLGKIAPIINHCLSVNQNLINLDILAGDNLSFGTQFMLYKVTFYGEMELVIRL